MIYDVSIGVQKDCSYHSNILKIECLTLEELLEKIKLACSFMNGRIEVITMNQVAEKKRFKGVEEK